jgi:hypothetical protein
LLTYSQYSETPVPGVHWKVVEEPDRVDPGAGLDIAVGVEDAVDPVLYV